MRLLIIIACSVALTPVRANELFAFVPSPSDIRANEQGETLAMTVAIDALILSISARSDRHDASLEDLGITVTSSFNGAKGKIAIPPSAYVDVVSPQLANLRVEADAGVYGHFHWIELPFGLPGKCFRPRRPLSRYAALTISIDYTKREARVGVRPQCANGSGSDSVATLPVQLEDE